MANLIYEVYWRCTFCDTEGISAIPLSEGCDTLFDLVLEAHASRNEECQVLHGHAGIAIRPPERELAR